MATHAHSTRTPLLPQPGNPKPLLGQGLGRQLGPVTMALRAMRAADPADQAIVAIEDGLAGFFAETNAVKSGIAALGKPGDFRFQDHGTRAMPATEPVPRSSYAAQFTHGIRALSRTEVENLVEGLIGLLDGWDGDADHEPNLDREPDEQDGCASEWTGRGAHRFNVGRAA